jgi:hypothetical protein
MVYILYIHFLPSFLNTRYPSPAHPTHQNILPNNTPYQAESILVSHKLIPLLHLWASEIRSTRRGTPTFWESQLISFLRIGTSGRQESHTGFRPYLFQVQHLTPDSSVSKILLLLDYHAIIRPSYTHRQFHK